MNELATRNDIKQVLDEIKNLEVRIDQKIDDKIDAFAIIVGKSFQSIEDRMATKEELAAVEARLESKMDKRFNKLDTKIDNYKGNTDRRIDWLTDAVTELKTC